jgi:uroporphyrinogen-III synthase
MKQAEDQRKKILLTRPQEDSERIRPAFEGLGYEVLIDPMLDVHFMDLSSVPIHPERSVLVVTSANSIRGLERYKEHQEFFDMLRHLPLYTVGDATAHIAENAGFKNVISAGRDVMALEALLGESLPEDREINYFCGVETAGNLDQELSNLGHKFTRIEIYDTKPAKAIRGEVLRSISQEELFAATFFSKKTADTFMTLAKEAAILDKMKKTYAIALSKNVLDDLQAAHWLGVYAAPEPTLDSLLKTFDMVKSVYF